MGDILSITKTVVIPIGVVFLVWRNISSQVNYIWSLVSYIFCKFLLSNLKLVKYNNFKDFLFYSFVVLYLFIHYSVHDEYFHNWFTKEIENTKQIFAGEDPIYGHPAYTLIAIGSCESTYPPFFFPLLAYAPWRYQISIEAYHYGDIILGYHITNIVSRLTFSLGRVQII